MVLLLLIAYVIIYQGLKYSTKSLTNKKHNFFVYVYMYIILHKYYNKTMEHFLV